MKLAREYLLPSNVARLTLATTIHTVLLSLYCIALWKHLPPNWQFCICKAVTTTLFYNFWCVQWFQGHIWWLDAALAIFRWHHHFALPFLAWAMSTLGSMCISFIYKANGEDPVRCLDIGINIRAHLVLLRQWWVHMIDEFMWSRWLWIVSLQSYTNEWNHTQADNNVCGEPMQILKP